ncbi:MAG: cobalamin-dependent protein [Planctomycetaceae bacterium]|nr:cobalamin-dependent protein [Planctomycetaceae bacterium]
MSDSESLFEAVATAKEDRVMALVREQIAAGVPATEILAECNRGMVELGNRFSSGDCFLPDLMFAGMIMKQAMAELSPLLAESEDATSRGTVVMGSVQHDVHDIGKDIVITMLRGVGFDVVDLGVDVPPEKFVEAITKHNPQVVGMSVLLTTCFKSVIATVAAIKQAGQREKVSLMVGGAAASDLLRQNAECDYYGRTAVDAVKFASSVAEAA